LGVLHPHEGSLYNWTHRALGGYWSFFIGFCAWFPGVLVIVAGTDIIVSFIQGLNSGWLVDPWQQGLVLIGLIIVTGFIATMRLRTVQYVVNVVIGLILLAVVIIGLAGLVWLAQGHPSATTFSDLTGWGIHFNGSLANINLFGLITLAYLGTEVPMNMGGELLGSSNNQDARRRIVEKHLLWGTVLVFIGYFVATFSVLVVQGSAASSAGGFALVTTVDKVLGPFMAKVTAICIMSFFIMVPIVYNYTFARLLLVGGIDQRLPRRIGLLNKNRVPRNAIVLQSIVAIIFTALAFLVLPYAISLGGKPSDLAIEVYNVSQAAATLVWAISSSFFFIDILVFYFRDRAAFLRQRIFPMPVLWVTVLLGPFACLLAIVDTLFFSWIGQIGNNSWWFIVGGITVICLMVAALGAMLASGEASWQRLGAS
jgi:amino acid transporter